MKQNIALKIGGKAGQGVKTAGYILTKSLKDLGHWTFSYTEYPSLIRGGHSTYQINIDKKKIYSVTQEVDILIALNDETVEKHYEEISKNGFLLLENDIKIKPSIVKYLKQEKIQVVKIPADEIVRKNEGLPVMRNSVLTGSAWALLTSEYKYLSKQVEKIFTKKSKDIKKNLKCTKGGFDYLQKQDLELFNLKPKDSKGRIIGTGNEVAGLATYASGCRLYSAYPMTPATGILHYLAARAPKTGMVVKQAEDEISAIQMAIGASFAGTRAATGTSGGGLALMTESLSLIGITEIPLVVFNSQRTGPATGMPTWTAQGDLDFVYKAGHGEFPRIIIAPGDIDEVFKLVPQAFNLADKFQTLVIFLLDKYLSASWYQTEKFSNMDVTVNRGQILDETELSKQVDFKRYRFTVSGISSRSLPGSKRGVYLSNSDEHNEKGYSTEDLMTRKLMMEKRMRKIPGIKADLPGPKLYGPKSAKTTIVCWGSQKGPVVDALDEVNNGKSKVNALHFSYIFPLKDRKLKSLAKKNNLIAVENNYSGQFAKLIKGETGIDIKSRITKYVGTPFFKDELVQILKSKV